jgi:ABC-type multidrug transport system ATPase subunit
VRFDRARIDVAGAPLLEGLSASVEGALVGLIGAWQALFLLCAGRAELASGRIVLFGRELDEARAAGELGAALSDPTLPADWNAQAYLATGAELCGHGRSSALRAARAALATLDLSHLAERRIRTLTIAEKRVLHVALALVDPPRVLAIEDPFRDLDEKSAALVAGVVERAIAGRTALIGSTTLPHTGPAHQLLSRAETLLVLEAGTLVAQGSPARLLAPGPRYLLTVAEHGRELAEHLAERGLRVELGQPSGGFSPLTADLLATMGGAARLIVELTGEATTRVVIEAASEVRAPVLELRPL